jgi:hypothetical protein
MLLKNIIIQSLSCICGPNIFEHWEIHAFLLMQQTTFHNRSKILVKVIILMFSIWERRKSTKFLELTWTESYQADLFTVISVIISVVLKVWREDSE